MQHCCLFPGQAQQGWNKQQEVGKRDKGEGSGERAEKRVRGLRSRLANRAEDLGARLAAWFKF